MNLSYTFTAISAWPCLKSPGARGRRGKRWRRRRRRRRRRGNVVVEEEEEER
jgi:hypothetical protein